jgi:hypothetical protein
MGLEKSGIEHQELSIRNGALAGAVVLNPEKDHGAAQVPANFV